jgi:hypothetical protein
MRAVGLDQLPLPLAGLKIRVLWRYVVDDEVTVLPPAIKTRPSASTVAV